jgi:YD repeat-containing protein
MNRTIKRAAHRAARWMAVTGVALSACAALAGSAANSYDSLGRLVKVTYSNGIVINYVYDASGNRTSYVVTGAPS